MPRGNAALEVPRIEAAAPQLCDGVSAHLKAIDAVDDDGLLTRQLAGPLRDSLRRPQLGRWNHVAALGKIIGQAHIEDDHVLMTIEHAAKLLGREFRVRIGWCAAWR